MRLFDDLTEEENVEASCGRAGRSKSTIPGALPSDWYLQFPGVRVYRVGNCVHGGIGFQDVWRVPVENGHYYYEIAGFHLSPSDCYESLDDAVVVANGKLAKSVEEFEYYVMLEELPVRAEDRKEGQVYLYWSKSSVQRMLESLKQKQQFSFPIEDWNYRHK